MMPDLNYTKAILSNIPNFVRHDVFSDKGVCKKCNHDFGHPWDSSQDIIKNGKHVAKCFKEEVRALAMKYLFTGSYI